MGHATNFRKQGDAILNRLGQGKPKNADAIAVPAALQGPLDEFAKKHAIYMAACDKADKWRLKRDKALAAVGAADDHVDKSIEGLAVALVAAHLGSRKNPFEGYTTHTPYGLTRLSQAEMASNARKLVATLLSQGVPADVGKAAGALLASVDALEAMRAALDVPQTEFAADMGKRDAMLPEWQHSLNALKAHAKVAWLDEPATYKAVFAVGK